MVEMIQNGLVQVRVGSEMFDTELAGIVAEYAGNKDDNK